MNEHPFVRALAALPADATHPLGLPQALAPWLTPHQRAPRHLEITRLPRAWLEYRLLALLALSGWSMRWALVEAEAAVRGIQPNSGTFKRCVQQLADAGLWETAVVQTVGTYALVRLTQRGQDLLRALGMKPVASEWERLECLHRGDAEAQAKHTAAVCVFAYHARKRGYETLVCPPLDDAHAEPDLLLQRGNHRLYVEVQRRGGDPWRRAAKWWNLVRLQGKVALCAMTPDAAQRLVTELRRCDIEHYLITDLHTLHRQDPPALWTLQSTSGFD